MFFPHFFLLCFIVNAGEADVFMFTLEVLGPVSQSEISGSSSCCWASLKFAVIMKRVHF